LGFGVLLAVAFAFEPLREALSGLLGDAVGGVGGVGGMVNLYAPSANCTTTHGGAEAPYCFVPGFVLGLTPFALIVLVLITLPLAISAAIAAKMQKASREPEEPSSRWYLAAWLMLSVVSGPVCRDG